MTTILVVDDEPPIVALLTELLEAEGYRVIAAADGGEALRQATQTLPDLVLSDITMPVLDGVTLCQRLHEGRETRRTPVILMGAARPAAVAAADDFVAKPFDFTRLLQVIARWTTRGPRRHLTPAPS